MGPHRYLHLRQLHLVRRALQYSLPGVARISDVARRHGFGGAGCFAAAYREQFGELPSETIRRILWARRSGVWLALGTDAVTIRD
jgi:AraC-like DNA-binding protein